MSVSVKKILSMYLNSRLGLGIKGSLKYSLRNGQTTLALHVSFFLVNGRVLPALAPALREFISGSEGVCLVYFSI